MNFSKTNLELLIIEVHYKLLLPDAPIAEAHQIDLSLSL